MIFDAFKKLVDYFTPKNDNYKISSLDDDFYVFFDISDEARYDALFDDDELIIFIDKTGESKLEDLLKDE